MARSTQPLGLAGWLGGGAAGLVALMTVGTLAAVLWRAGGLGPLQPADWAAVRFTLLQAAVSAGISVLLAVPVARALARRQFAGRRLLVTLLGAPFVLPVIVGVLGILAIFGRAGLVNGLLGWLSLGPFTIYGPAGVVLAHVFFNLPLAVRLILQGWIAIPAERFRLAASLGFGPAETARFIERPMLKAVLPGTFLAIFLICLTSFAVALTLGGGPAATTVELAIYQAFRFDFDLGHAAALAALQYLLCFGAALLALGLSVPSGFGAGLDRPVQRWDAASRLLRAQDAALLLATGLFVLLPMAAVMIDGLGRVATLPPSLWRAAFRSLVMALVSAGLTLVLVLALAELAVRLPGRGGRALDALVMLALATSPLVVGTGLYLILRGIATPGDLALPVTVAVNTTLALPFALRAVLPARAELEAGYGRLAASLGLGGTARLRYLTLPRLRPALGFAGGIAAALSMGDLGVIALFADHEQATLPLQLYRLMAAYRMEDARGAAVLLMALSFGLFWAFDRGGRLNADT